MRNKRIWVRAITRVLYAGGIVFLVSGVLLSAISIPVLAAQNSAAGSAAATSTACPCQSQTPAPAITHTPGSGGSSLIFTSGCNCSCSNTQAVVCNVGSSNMQQSVNWDLYFSADGNPVLGQKISTGKLGPLNVGQCTTLNYTPIKPGFYAYVVKQEPTHEGPGTVWSNSCEVNGVCFPTATPGKATATNTPVSPTQTHTPAPAATGTATHAPMAVNLSAVCGYATDTTMLWKVADHTGQDVNFTWKVTAGSSESGSGHVAGNSDTYFTTSTAAKTVELLVNNERVDSENAVAPCKQNLMLSYACTGQGLAWTLRNPNNFAIDVVWKLDGKEGGHGPLAASAQVQLVVSQPGAHTVEVDWTDTRPGSHHVTLTSDVNSCVNIPPVTVTVPPTNTPIATIAPTQTNTPVPPSATPIPNTSTPLPAPTMTVPANTFTPTPTFTRPANTFTPTPTFTRPANTFTPTPTFTRPANTVTPAPTNTQPGPTLTPTNTNTVPAATVTPSLTATMTSTPPPAQTSPPNTIPTFTLTPVPASATPVPPTATPSATFTATTIPSPTVVNTVPPPVAVSTPIIIPVTGADMLAPARTGGLIGKLFINIGLVLLGMALAMTGLSRKI